MSEYLDTCPYTVELDRSEVGLIVNDVFKQAGRDERWFKFFKGNGSSDAVDQGIMTIGEARRIAEGRDYIKYFFDEENGVRYQEVGYHMTDALKMVSERLEVSPSLLVLVKEDDEKLGVQIMINGSPQL